MGHPEHEHCTELCRKKGTVLLSTSLAWPAVAGCSQAETFSQLSTFSFAQPCTLHAASTIYEKATFQLSLDNAKDSKQHQINSTFQFAMRSVVGLCRSHLCCGVCALPRCNFRGWKMETFSASPREGKEREREREREWRILAQS